MLIVLLHNDGTGKGNMGNYDAEVRVNDRCIWRGRVYEHDRATGWPRLLEQLALVGKMGLDHGSRG